MASTEVQMWRCAEQFRPGQISYIRQVQERKNLIPNVTSWDVGGLILQEIEDGVRFLGNCAEWNSGASASCA